MIGGVKLIEKYLKFNYLNLFQILKSYLAGIFWNCKELLKLRGCGVFFPCSSSDMNSVDTNSVKNPLVPPSRVYGMKKLDREAFKTEVEVPSVEVPVENIKVFLKDLKPYLLKINKLNPVQGDDKKKKILLNPIMFQEMSKKLSLNNICWTKLTLSYENFNHETIFKSVLPLYTGGHISSFSIIGHIIHINLKTEILDYKYLIGEVLLDKHQNIKTVVNKAQTIDTEYRNFEIELLAGEPNYEVTVKENGIQYAFDFSKVFWNPRLVHEHQEIVKKATSGDIVFDVFAGVGPFAVPLAKKKCVVHANDLNPDSYKWLCHNAKLNKVSGCLSAYNLDGREFIKTVVKENLIKLWKEGNKCSVHILMNLPACALEFLDAYEGLLEGHEFNNIDMPVIYCYFFSKKDENAMDIIKKYLNEDFKDVNIATVRLVAPNKRMMRLSYKMSSSVLFSSEKSCNEPGSKRIKLSS